MKIYQIHYSTSKHKQKLRLAADIPQSLGITDLSRAYHLRSSVLLLFFSFCDENISDTLFRIQTYSEAEIGSWYSSFHRDLRIFSRIRHFFILLMVFGFIFFFVLFERIQYSEQTGIKKMMISIILLLINNCPTAVIEL
jgi:hypothetical protein